MFARALTPFLRDAAAQNPVVTLIGPRQSGKTTLARATFPDLAYVSLETPDVRLEANEDPRGFLARLGNGAILDEVQRAPDLPSYLQEIVDRDPRPGRFVLTGSQNLLLMDRVSQSLAGRTAIARLLPLTLAELEARTTIDPSSLDAEPGASDPPHHDLWQLLFSGLYPRIHDRSLDPARWLADYFATYVERDLREVLRVLDLAAFERFVRLAAARTGQELSLSSLGEDAGITQPTARQWMTALEIAFIAKLIPPHHENFGKRLRRRPKLFFLDTGLVCLLLGIQSAETLSRHPLRGAIFETFVAGELLKAFANRGREAPLYFWRDATGHEIDFVLDLGDRRVGIEVKVAQTFGSHMTDGLRWWRALKGNERSSGVLIHGGDRPSTRDGLVVRPWFLA
ncbi:MAG: ATP-binding protein [Candidatus Eisenbacteria bacterium]